MRKFNLHTISQQDKIRPVSEKIKNLRILSNDVQVKFQD
jgi:hypothetical protein